MKHVTNFPLFNGCLKHYGNMEAVANDCRELGIDGLEVIWDHLPYTEQLPPSELVVGYHMLFWSNWIDFWKQDRAALLDEFGTWDMVKEYYYGETPDTMVARYKADLQHALDLKAEYLVFHVSEVSIEECFTYSFKHRDEDVIDCAAELINQVLDGVDAPFTFLVENQWWSGFRFTDAALTKRLLDGIAWTNKGVMLDTGHLLHTNTALRTQAEAVDYIRHCYDTHADAGVEVRGLHLHQSLTGAYIEGTNYHVPDDFPDAYWDQFTRCYNHILQIDKHEPWTDPAIASLVEHMAPEWVNHELSAWPRDAHKAAVATQLATLGLR